MNPNAPSDLCALDARLALAVAGVDLSFQEQPPMGQVQAMLVKCHWISPDPSLSRVALLLADRRGLRLDPGADPGIAASALAAKVRSALMDAGATGAPSYLDDFPSAPFLASADVCSSSCAVSMPLGMEPALLDAACAGALESMFRDGTHFRRHLKTSVAGSGDVERAANRLLGDLRAARARA